MYNALKHMTSMALVRLGVHFATGFCGATGVAGSSETAASLVGMGIRVFHGSDLFIVYIGVYRRQCATSKSCRAGKAREENVKSFGGTKIESSTVCVTNAWFCL